MASAAPHQRKPRATRFRSTLASTTTVTSDKLRMMWHEFTMTGDGVTLSAVSAANGVEGRSAFKP
jgi:hypothetical protein